MTGKIKKELWPLLNRTRVAELLKINPSTLYRKQASKNGFKFKERVILIKLGLMNEK